MIANVSGLEAEQFVRRPKATGANPMKRVLVDDQPHLRQRLFVLAEFSVHTGQETARQPLLDTFASAACRIADADAGVVVMVESAEVERIATCGMGADDAILAALRTAGRADEGAIREALAQAGVPAGACAVVVMPVTRAADARLILIRSDERPFTADDRALAATLTAQAAITYDNLMLRDALMESERGTMEKYRTLLVNLPGVKWTADRSGRVLYVSPSIVYLIGHTSEEIYGDARDFFTGLIHPDDRERADLAYRQLFEESKPFEVEYRVRHKDGRWVWIHNHAVTAYERGGTLLADGVATDVTARAQAEAEKGRLSRERDLLLSSAAEGILGLDSEGRVSFANPAAAAILGYSAEELPGGNAHDLFHLSRRGANREESCSLCAAQSAGIQDRVNRVTLRRKDHTPVEVEMVVAPVVDEGQVRGRVLVFSDVTERNLLERRLEQTTRVASLGRVAATIAHEFNNVLMGIQPFAEIVRRTAAGNERLLNAAEHITKAVQRGKRIAQEILRFTRPATVMMKPVEAVQALNELVQELNEGLPPTCRVVLDAPDRPVAVLADWPQLEQVITNLVINARDAMEGRGVVTLTVDDKTTNGDRQPVREPEKYVHLKCSDTGAGISPEVAERIFEPLFTTKKTGTGLGLAVAQQVVAGHGGEIWVESKPGEGTTFHLLIPRSRS